MRILHLSHIQVRVNGSKSLREETLIITHLSLTNFRNYAGLEFNLPPHTTVMQGDNAQGKSNLLEAIYVLATSRSPRTYSDRELINWDAFQEEIPACRIAASVQKAGSSLKLEVALSAKAAASPQSPDFFSRWPPSTKGASVQKRIRINGIVRHAADLIGQLNVVTFSVYDIDLVGGEPALRRRYLDITNSQIDHKYLRNLQRYNRVLWQRNQLLRLIAENTANPDELAFWDQQLVETGTYLTVQREHTVAILDRLAQGIHDELSGGQGKLSLAYFRSIDKQRGKEDSQVKETAEVFTKALQVAREKEIAQGMSLVGPHRDDLRFFVDEVDAGGYTSRGQQRTIALSLKLAEAKFMLDTTKEHPVLLLDDVLSELDARRRHHLLGSAANLEQVIITTTDLDRFEQDFLAQVSLFRVTQGRIEPQLA
jgi:DNA replication and repair protein RecF